MTKWYCPLCGPCSGPCDEAGDGRGWASRCPAEPEGDDDDEEICS